MNYKFFIPLIIGSFFISGCYTQLETIERERPVRSVSTQPDAIGGSAYDNYYTEEEYELYQQGYFDGIFDASLDFRTYSHRRFTVSSGFHWGRPFYGYGFSYGYYYDPFWRYSQLYDPYFYSFYGFYRYPFYNRYRHFGHFYSPWSGFGSNYIVIYNNVGSSGSSSVVQGPRGSGIHRGTVTNTRDNRVAGAGVASRDDRTRTRGGINPSSGYVNTPNSRIRTSDGSIIPNGRAAATTVDRRRSVPTQTQRAIPQRTRSSNNSGNVNRSSGSSSNNSGTVNRTRNTRSSSSGTVNRTRGSSQQASPQRSRSSSNNNNSSGNRSRDRGNN